MAESIMVQMDCQIRQMKNSVESCFPAWIPIKIAFQTVWGNGLRAGTKEFPPRLKSERDLLFPF